ncbi:MAG: HDOD domain-containing protein [Actinomycetota bacterium]
MPEPVPTTAPAVQPSILFVDDDEHVLAGLRSVLRRRLRNCRLTFAPGPLEAIEHLDHHDVDLVVVDIKMPAMDGVELLRTVRSRHPMTLRYVLSGEAGSELVTGGLPIAHRWLSKPCPSDDLADAITRALVLRRVGLADDPEIRRALAATDALPTPPQLYGRLQRLMADESVTIDEAAALVASDPAVAAKVLQWANSALVGRPPVGRLADAVARLGLDLLSKLVLSVEAVRLLRTTERIPGLDQGEVQQLSIATGDLAARLAHPDEAADAAVAGLLWPVGLLLESIATPTRLRHAYLLADELDRDLVDVERELHGVDHHDLAVQLLTVWGLPADLVSLVGLAGGHPKLDIAPPFDAVDAVRAARLLALGRTAGVGRPHLEPISSELSGLLEDWDRARPPGQGGSP